jgi:branched-chain amino acid transport system permease protein
VRGISGFAGSFYRINPIHSGIYGVGDLRFSSRNLWVIVVGWGVAALSTLVVFLLVRSPWGRVLRSIREDEDAARSLGKNVFGYKLQSLVLGGVIGAFAGMLLAVDTQFVGPDTYIAVLTFFAYIVMIMGGPARVLGPILGAILFWFLLQATDGLLTQAINHRYITFLHTTDVGAVRFALVGLGLMLLMAFRPQGILGRKEEQFIDER